MLAFWCWQVNWKYKDLSYLLDVRLKAVGPWPRALPTDPFLASSLARRSSNGPLPCLIPGTALPAALNACEALHLPGSSHLLSYIRHCKLARSSPAWLRGR